MLHALSLLAGQGSALMAPTLPVVVRPGVHRSYALRMDAAQQNEIDKLKAKLKAAEAEIAALASSPRGAVKEPAADDFEHSRFPLFRKVQSSLGLSKEQQQQQQHVAPSKISMRSVEQLFSKYDVDRSGLLDINEFRTFVTEMNLPVPDLSAMAQDTAKSAETLVSDTARSADGFAKSVGKSVLGGVNELVVGVNDLAASAGVPGATARTPVTLVGGCGSGYKEILSAVSLGKDMPVEPLILAIERQATLTTQLGGFMQLIVKLDQSNMKVVRESWERHGKPQSLRELLEAEVAEGVVEPTRLREGSAALSLLWSMRAKRFWTMVADGFADQEATEPSSAFGIRAYEKELEPYHRFLFKNTFRTALRALPSREEMLGNMALMPAGSMGLSQHWEGWEESAAAGEGLTAEERMAACLVELRKCSEATKRVTNMVQAQLDELELRDDRKL